MVGRFPDFMTSESFSRVLATSPFFSLAVQSKVVIVILQAFLLLVSVRLLFLGVAQKEWTLRHGKGAGTQLYSSQHDSPTKGSCGTCDENAEGVREVGHVHARGQTRRAQLSILVVQQSVCAEDVPHSTCYSLGGAREAVRTDTLTHSLS